MIEVFKTNVDNAQDAGRLIDFIHQRFVHYSANFDLQDCDNILRIESCNGEVHIPSVISLLSRYGFAAEVLPDDISVRK